MKRIWTGIATATAVTSIAACGSGGTKSAAASEAPVASSSSQAPTSSTAAPKVDYGKQYLALVGPDNQAHVAFSAKLGTEKTVASTAGSVPQMDAVLAADQKFQSALLRAQWPANTQADIRTLVTALAEDDAALTKWEIDLRAKNYSAANPDGEAWVASVTKSATAANAVRADLGLPPPS